MSKAEARKLVDAKIAGKRVMVFSKSGCPYCSMAKDVLKKYLGKELDPSDYEVLEIGSRDDCAAIQDYLREITGARSVPRVFIDGKCIGGGSETQAAHSNGQLKQMLIKV